MNWNKLIVEAVNIHKQLIANHDSDPQIVDTCLEQQADRIHEILYTKATSSFFKDYVLSVHYRTRRSTWLCGRPGVNELLKTLGVNW